MARRNWLDVLGLFQDARATEIGLPHAGTSWSLMMPASDIDPNPIGTTKEKLQAYVGWVFAAASLISEDVSSTRWDVWRKRGRSRKEWEVVQRHPVLNLLRRPNEQQTWGTLLELTDLHMSLGGEAFWHVITNEVATPVGLQVIYPHWIDQAIIEGGRVIGWRVIPPGQPPFIIPKDDFIRIYRPHPLEPLRAASPVEAFAVSHYMDLYYRAYAMSTVRNDGGVPAGLLSTDQELTPTQATAIAEGWKQRYGQTRGEVSVLGRGATYQPIAIPIEDLRFLEIGQFTREQILAAYRVPPAVLGMSTDFNRANMEAAMVAYQRQALLPRLHRYAEAINVFLLPRLMGDAAASVEFEFENPVDEDEVAHREKATIMLQNASMTVNEYRETLGLDPLPGGNVFLVPVRTHALASSLTPVEPQAPAGDEESSGDAERTPSLLGSVENLELLAVRRENRRLRVEALERKHYLNLRGFFARCYRDSKGTGVIHLPAQELEERGVPVDDVDLCQRDGESMTEHAERLKSSVAKRLARELAEREVLA